MERGRPERRKSRQDRVQARKVAKRKQETIRNATKVVLKQMETKKDQLAQCHLTMTAHD